MLNRQTFDIRSNKGSERQLSSPNSYMRSNCNLSQLSYRRTELFGAFPFTEIRGNNHLEKAVLSVNMLWYQESVCLPIQIQKKRHSTSGSRLTVSQFFHNMTTRNFN